MTLYGLRGFYHHGWSKVLTVMSPAGASAALRHVQIDDGLSLKWGHGQLSRYVEQRERAIERLVEQYGITVLTKPEWDAKKAELGDAIYR